MCVGVHIGENLFRRISAIRYTILGTGILSSENFCGYARARAAGETTPTSLKAQALMLKFSAFFAEVCNM